MGLNTATSITISFTSAVDTLYMALVSVGQPSVQVTYDFDRSFAIDHFPAKLLKLSDGFQTETGRKLAEERHERLNLFLTLFRDEI